MCSQLACTYHPYMKRHAPRQVAVLVPSALSSGRQQKLGQSTHHSVLCCRAYAARKVQRCLIKGTLSRYATVRCLQPACIHHEVMRGTISTHHLRRWVMGSNPPLICGKGMVTIIASVKPGASAGACQAVRSHLRHRHASHLPACGPESKASQHQVRARCRSITIHTYTNVLWDIRVWRRPLVACRGPGREATAAVVVQRHWRGHLQRAAFLELREEVVPAAVTVQCSFRVWGCGWIASAACSNRASLPLSRHMHGTPPWLALHGACLYLLSVHWPIAPGVQHSGVGMHVVT
jgi:hypothetical protein